MRNHQSQRAGQGGASLPSDQRHVRLQQGSLPGAGEEYQPTLFSSGAAQPVESETGVAALGAVRLIAAKTRQSGEKMNTQEWVVATI